MHSFGIIIKTIESIKIFKSSIVKCNSMCVCAGNNFLILKDQEVVTSTHTKKIIIVN